MTVTVFEAAMPRVNTRVKQTELLLWKGSGQVEHALADCLHTTDGLNHLLRAGSITLLVNS
jgi:hypothetical protein